MEEEKQKQGRWARFKESSRNNYRLVIMNNETFDEIGSYKLTPLNLYIALSTLLLLLAILMFFLIAYTPLRKFVPGYGDVVQRQEMLSLQQTVDDLMQELDAQHLKTEALYRTMRGEFTTGEDVQAPEEGTETLPEAVPQSEEEIQLRREMELDRIGEAARNQSAAGPVNPGDQAVRLEQMLILPPITGEISAGFNPADGHLGVDVLAPNNTPIKAALDGIVFQSEYTSAHGYVIGIQHANNILTFYKHNSRLLKDVGSTVNAGEAIAIIGDTGTRSSGPHLHFEIWQNGEVLDPTNYLSF